ncbi:FMN-binding protein [Oribacterium sp. oral taxon 108]|uniref:FMN-binding protein n=1 Tax=Oribacterium sp. oral taxon 108 TaxID=712414 RepID=UPI00020DD5DC|nr:FMN-binding protein [Oribacterium sp. oral taxon 108]EGL37182.1 FMN-binding domain protein [Oribacterium sp. oral taxon 108 str. F0425]
MIVILTLLCSLAFFHFFGKAVKKKPAVLYGICILLSLVSIFYPREGGLPFLDFFFKKIMQRGVLAGSLFIWVMLAPVLPKSFSGRKTIYLLRGEMAICASLITLAHNLAFGGKYFGALFFGQGHISLMELHAAIVSCLMILLLIPLTVTSFQAVRRKMQGKTWKKLQNWSYLFYLLLYLHIFFIYQGALLRGKGEYFFTLMLYSFIFGFYGFLRIRQYRMQKESKEKKAFPLLRIAGILPIVCLFLSGFYSAGKYRAALEANVDKIRAQESVAESIGNGEENNSSEKASEASGDKASTNSSDASSDSQAADEDNISGAYKDGECFGKASAYNGNVEVKVTISGGKITAIDIVKTKDDEEYFFDAQKKVIPEILEKQSTDVDAVAGATTSSEGICHAVQKALEQAKQ